MFAQKNSRFVRKMLDYLFQRALAPVFAIAVRCAAVNFAALALPPLRPPRRPRLTAAASFPSNDGSGSRSSTSPLAISIINLASWAGSRGRFKRFSGMVRICAKIRQVSRGFELRQFKRAHYRIDTSVSTAPNLPRAVSQPFCRIRGPSRRRGLGSHCSTGD